MLPRYGNSSITSIDSSFGLSRAGWGGALQEVDGWIAKILVLFELIKRLTPEQTSFIDGPQDFFHSVHGITHSSHVFSIFKVQDQSMTSHPLSLPHQLATEIVQYRKTVMGVSCECSDIDGIEEDIEQRSKYISLFDTSEDIKLPWHPTIHPHCFPGICTVVQHAKNVNQFIRKVVAPPQNHPEGVSVDQIVCLPKVYKGQIEWSVRLSGFLSQAMYRKDLVNAPTPFTKATSPGWHYTTYTFPGMLSKAIPL